MIQRIGQAVLVLVVVLAWLEPVYGQSPSKLAISSKAEQLSGELIDRNERDKNGQVCAGLAIVSDLIGFTFESYNGIVKSTHQPGRDLLFLSPDERVVTLYKSGYEPLKIILRDLGISLKSGSVWQVKITGEKKADLLPIVIITTPPEAMVSIDGIRRGTGKTHQVTPGKHTIRIEKDGFGPVEETVDVSSSSFEFPVVLKEVDVALTTIASIPPGAKLVVNGSLRGETDRSLYLYPGTYSLRLDKTDYLPIDTTIIVREVPENRFVHSLVKNLGFLVLSVEPARATVLANLRPLDIAKPVELPPGEYDIVVSKDGYLPQSMKVSVTRGGRIAKTITLERNAGTLLFSVTPPEAQVLINRENYSEQRSVDLPPGIYRIDLAYAGYDSLSETITIARGATLEKKYSLKQKVGKVQFSVVPIAATVVMSRGGMKVGEWTGAKYLRDIPVGTYEITCRLSGYKSVIQSVQIDDRKSVVIDIVMKTGSDVNIEWIIVEGGPTGSFSMSATEVTFEQYDTFCEATGHEKPKTDFGRGKQPVINVNVEDALAFCAWMSNETGKTVRLPEENEWEFAAKGGEKSRGYEYSGSNTLDEVAWHVGNSRGGTHEVATKSRNELGFYDMSGNVWEWCGTAGTTRGGSWFDSEYGCRVSYQTANDDGDRSSFIGFRLLQK